MWFLLGLFIVSAALVLAGLVLRLVQGRIWLVHAIDRTVLIPNISVWYGVCAVAYAALGMLNIIDSINISKGRDYPSHYLALQIVWPAILWLGIYSEIWATFAAYMIRRVRSLPAERNDKGWRVALATVLPFVLPVIAFVPSAVFFALGVGQFNKSIRLYSGIRDQIDVFKSEWQPADGMNLGKCEQSHPKQE